MRRDPIVLGEGCVLSGEDIGITRCNNNVLVVGASGCGKSLSVLMPTIAESEHSNPILNYAKEYDGYCMERFLSYRGYENSILNIAHPEKSTISVDPMMAISSFEDIEALSAMIINSTITKTVDDYWQAKARPLLSSLIAATFMTAEPDSIPGMIDVLKLFDKLIPHEAVYGIETELDSLYSKIEKMSPGCYAVREYKAWRNLPFKTGACIRDTISAALSTVFPESVRNILQSKPQFDAEKFVKNKQSLIVITNSIDTSQQYYANIVYRNIERSLLKLAATCPNGELPREVRFFFDDFAGTTPITGFPQDLCLFRSAGISAIILLQAESTLESIYKEDAAVIRANCSCYCYFPGGMDDRSADITSKRFGVPYEEVLYAPIGKVFVMRAGHKPIHIQRFNTLESKGYQEYLAVNGLADRDELKYDGKNK